jgi:hypothetical protein
MRSNPIIAHLNKRARQTAIEDADEVEWQAIREGSAICEYGIADEQISGSLFDQAELVEDENTDALSSPLAWEIRSEAEEKKSREITEEIERRCLLLESHYPFKANGNLLEYVPSGDGLYEFCLAVSMSGSLVKAPFNELPQAFEALATEVLVAWMGPGAKGWQTGYPGRVAAGWPRELPELWRIIHEETGEWEWQQGKEVPEDAADDQKDLGMDTLIWKSVHDSRTQALFLAGQCACGRDALSGSGKSADLTSKWLEEWFRTQSKVEFVPCLLLPRCLGASATEIRARAGTLFFDRIRLVLAARQAERPGHPVIDQRSSQRYAKLIEMVKQTAA